MCIRCAYVLEHVENEEVLENKREEPWKIAKILNWSESLGLSTLDQKRKQKKFCLKYVEEKPQEELFESYNVWDDY